MQDRGAGAGEGGGIIKSTDAGADDAADLDQGGDDGLKDGANQDADQDEPIEGAGTDPDGGTEGGEADRDRAEDAEKPGAEKGGREPSEIDALKAIIAQTQEQLKAVMAPKPPEAPAPREMSDEEWAKVEESWGGMPRQQIQQITGQSLRLKEMLEATMNKRFAKYEKESVINRLAETPEARDIKTYRAEIEEFLGHFDEGQHSDEKLLKLALVFARGKRAPQAARAAAGARESQKRIVGAGRPHTGGGAPAARPGVKLSVMERQAARAAGMSEKEYAELKRK